MQKYPYYNVRGNENIIFKGFILSILNRIPFLFNFPQDSFFTFQKIMPDKYTILLITMNAIFSFVSFFKTKKYNKNWFLSFHIFLGKDEKNHMTQPGMGTREEAPVDARWEMYSETKSYLSPPCERDPYRVKYELDMFRGFFWWKCVKFLINSVVNNYQTRIDTVVRDEFGLDSIKMTILSDNKQEIIITCLGGSQHI